MQINNSIAFVTGANRGLGLALVHELVARGAKKVYAAMRTPVELGLPGVVTIQLDVTKPQEVAAAAALCSDTTLLINNAGIASIKGYLEDDSLAVARELFETNYFGMVQVSQAFAPVLSANGGGTIVNVLSVVSWIGSTMLAPYAATKAAAWSFTNSLRLQLREQGTQVVGLHVGFMDTDLVRDLQAPKIPPHVVAQRTIEAVEAGKDEVLADEMTYKVKQGLTANPAVYLVPLAR